MSPGAAWLRRRAILMALGALLAGRVPASALADAPAAEAPVRGMARESAVKAAFLYRFGSFVEWPAAAFDGPAEPLVIGVFGDEAVAAELEDLAAGRRVEGRAIRVRRVRSTEGLGGLHILFVGGPQASRMREMLAAVRGPVLTVADAALGGEPAVLHFVREGGRVRFGASLSAAQARGVQLSAKLLAVAQHVEGR